MSLFRIEEPWILDSKLRDHGFHTSTGKRNPIFEHTKTLPQGHPKEVTARVANLRKTRSIASY